VTMKRQILITLAIIAAHQTMTSQSNTQLLANLHDRYESFKVSGIDNRRFTQEEFLQWIAPAVASGAIRAERVGQSGEGRPLTLYTYGTGPVSIFLWSQMHGDESTATMAIADIFSFFQTNPEDPIVSRIRKTVTLHVLPMVNPDGAQRFQRRTSDNIDINRDALRLATPEARTLKSVRDRLDPDFGFNLHDQDPRYTVGTSGNMTAIALLAPPTDASRMFNETRARARHLASSIAQMLSSYIPGRIARWDDTFEPRAFGDNVQKWGTSTVLIESGGWPGDPEKMYLRKMNTLALLWSFLVAGDGTYAQADTAAYEELPFNMKLGFDLLIENALLRQPENGQLILVDIGLNLEERFDDSSRVVTRRWSVEDVGDLSTYAAYRRVDMKSTPVSDELLMLEKKFSPEMLKSLIPLK